MPLSLGQECLGTCTQLWQHAVVIVPRELPAGAPPPCFMHRQGVFEICIQQVVNVAFLQDRHDAHLPKMLKLAVRLGKTVVTTDLLPLNDEMSVLLEGNYTFATEPDGPRDLAQGLVVVICEPGVSLARKRKRRDCCEYCTCGVDCPLWIKLLFCWHLVRYSIGWSFRLAGWLVYFFYWKVWVLGVDVFKKALGGHSIVALSKPILRTESSWRPSRQNKHL